MLLAFNSNGQRISMVNLCEKLQDSLTCLTDSRKNELISEVGKIGFITNHWALLSEFVVNIE